MRTVVRSWRWPRLRREFLRRRFLKAMTLGPRVCSTSSAVTLAPETSGLPTLTRGALADHQHVCEFDFCSGVPVELFDRQNVVFGDTILLAARLDDSEHDCLFPRFAALWVSSAPCGATAKNSGLSRG